MATTTSAILVLLLSCSVNGAGIKWQLPKAFAQSIDPNVPPPPELPEPRPIPSEIPLEIPPTAPRPEIPINIPGRVGVRKFLFFGNSPEIFTEAELQQEVADFTGRPITFVELLQAADRITQLYIREGYITSGAYIPAPGLNGEFPIENGNFPIQIVEGRLEAENIQVTVENGRLENYVRSRLIARSAGVLNFNRLQSALILLQQDPLIENLSAQLTAGTQPGSSELIVRVTGAPTFTTVVSLDNNRNPSIGSFQRRLGISEANLLGAGDNLTVAYGNTDGSNEINTSYTIPVNPRDGTLNLSFRYVDNDILEAPFDELDIESRSRYYDVTYRQPIILRGSPEVIQELAVGLNFSRRENDSTLSGKAFPVSPGADERGKTRVSAIRFFQEWTESRRRQVLVARSQFSAGVGALDATVSNNEADSRFFAWRGQALWLRLLGEATGEGAIAPTLLVRLDLQLADELLPLEQFGLGGQATVRGYRQDVLLTDNGVLASVEARLPVLRVAEIDGNLQIIPFIDFGAGWNTNRENPDPNALVGAGVGLRWEMWDSFSARLDYGIPLVDVDSRDKTWQENGVYFTVEYDVKF